MVAFGYAADDKISKAGDTMTGLLTLEGSPFPLNIPAGAGTGLVLTSDGAGNASWSPGAESGADWVNVVAAAGADPTETSDSTTSIQNALNATPLGGVCFLPAGRYKVSGQITVPTGVTLRGNQGFRSASRSHSYIRPSSSFSGASVLTMATGTPAAAIENLVLDGVNLTGGNTADGVDLLGGAKQWSLTGLVVRNFGQYGINIATSGGANPDGGLIRECSVTNSGSDGIHWAYCVDSMLINCHCDSNGGAGVWLGNINNTSLIGCKSQSNLTGYEITGSFAKPNGALIGCFSENNTNNGFLLTSLTNAGSIAFIGCNSRDDGDAGTSGSGWAGFNLSASGIDLILTGCSNFLTSSAAGPDYGLVLANCTGSVSVTACSLLGSVAGFLNGGGNTHLYVGSDVSIAVGESDSKTITAKPYLATPSVTTLDLGQPGDTVSRLAADNTGKLLFGSGSATSDVNLYRGAANVLTADSSLSVGGHALGLPLAADFGASAWSLDPVLLSANQVLTNGTVYLAAVPVQKAFTTAHVLWNIQTAAATATSGQNFVGIYDFTGVLKGSAGVDAAVVTTGLISSSLAVALIPGMYWVAFLFNCSGAPATVSLYRTSSSAQSSSMNLGGGATAARFATNATGRTTLPSPMTISGASNTQLSYGIFAALS